jgi:beta-N-acetylhexosaminidase
MKALSSWVKARLSEMSLEQKIAQMLMPNFRPQRKPEEMESVIVPGVDPGGVFFFSGTSAEFRRAAEWLQARCGVPALVSSDLESGAGRMIGGCVNFPDLMGLAAAGDLGLAREMGRVTALEARGHGVHWTFGPVVDVNANPYNPIVNTRSLGDRAESVSALAQALIAGMQENGLAACAKHFPGDGWDDRDQHLCTTVNPLSLDEWERHSGKVFADAIGAGVKSVMVGHIALPCVDPGEEGDPLGPPPATFSRKILTGLLRGRMGFEGVIVTDAMEMGGLVTRVRDHADLVVACVNAGCDVLLFCEARKDFEIIRGAVNSGRIGLGRVEEAAARVLTLKEELGLISQPGKVGPGRDLGAEEREAFGRKADAVAQKAVTLVSDKRQSAGPLRLQPGTHILAIHLRSNPEYNVDGFDSLLREAGFGVTRKTEADLTTEWGALDYSGYAAVMFLWNMGPTWGTSDIRPGGTYMRIPWFVRQAQPRCPVIHLNFGNPYIAHELPWADYLLNAYSPDEHSQRAALDIILGRAEARGVSPVELDRPERLNALMARELAAPGK